MRTIIAAYHDRGNADAAVADLGAMRASTKVDIIDDKSAGRSFLDSLTKLNVPRDRAELYTEAVRRGSVVVVARAADDNAEQIAAIFDRHRSLDLERAHERWRSEGWTGHQPGASALDEDARRLEHEQLQRESFDVIEEEVRIGKREVGAGGVRVRTFVSERPITQDVTLREERVAVSRERADEPVAPEATDTTFTEQEYVVTATTEQPVVQKEARVVERVKVEKEAETRTETIEETERRRDVAVEPLEPDRPGRH
jgi:stress response protein YsnF